MRRYALYRVPVLVIIIIMNKTNQFRPTSKTFVLRLLCQLLISSFSGHGRSPVMQQKWNLTLKERGQIEKRNRRTNRAASQKRTCQRKPLNHPPTGANGSLSLINSLFPTISARCEAEGRFRRSRWEETVIVRRNWAFCVFNEEVSSSANGRTQMYTYPSNDA